MTWSNGDVSLSQTLTDNDHLYPGHINELREAVDTYINVKNYGAKGDGLTDDTSSIQAAIDVARVAGKTVFIPSGYYLISSTLVVNNSSSVYYFDTKKINIIGSGLQTTILKYSGTGPCLMFLNGTNGTGNSFQSYQSVKDLRLEGTNRATGTKGISVGPGSFLHFENIATSRFDYGMYLIDTDFASFTACVFEKNNRGTYMASATPYGPLYSTMPNSNNFFGCNWIGNVEYGAYFDNPSVVNIFGGASVGNGIGGVDGSNYGFLFANGTQQGALGCNITGVYFEQNKGQADIWIYDVAVPTYLPNHSIYNITGNSFTNNTDTNFVTNNITISLVAANVEQQKVIITGNGFKNFPAYTPSASRPHVGFVGDARSADNCYFKNNVQTDDAEKVTED